MKLRTFALVLVSVPGLVLAAHCGGDSAVTPVDDAGGGDTSQPDVAVAKDAAKDTSQPIDASDAAVPDDVQVDAPIDATPLDGGIGSLNGLVLWLDAAKGITKNGNAVATWADQSSAKNDATAGNVAPTFTASAINSLPAVTFSMMSVNNLVIADSSTLQFGTADYSIFVVSRFDNDPKSGPTTGLADFFTKAGKNSGILFYGNNLNPKNSTITAGMFAAEDANDFLGASGAYNDGTARLYALVRTSNVITLRVNGSQVGTLNESAPVDVSAAATDVLIGAFPQGKNTLGALDGDIAEMIAVKGSISSNDLASVESYFKSKYAL